jgi:anti-anti-sigma factor
MTMTTTPGVIRVRRAGRTVTFQVTGRATILHSLPLRRCADRSLDRGATELRIDLRGCTYMDSTFLGTLLFLQRKTQERKQARMVLISPSLACRQLLRQMDLEGFFAAEEQPSEPVNGWVELDGDQETEWTKQSILQAHQELARTVGGEFRTVARLMEEETRASHGP